MRGRMGCHQHADDAEKGFSVARAGWGGTVRRPMVLQPAKAWMTTPAWLDDATLPATLALHSR